MMATMRATKYLPRKMKALAVICSVPTRRQFLINSMLASRAALQNGVPWMAVW
jgi:hypothetical protein